MRFDDRLRDRQSESGPPVGAGAGRVGAIEPFEDVRQILPGDPEARIRHLEAGRAIPGSCGDVDLSSLAIVFDRIGQQVCDDLREPAGVAPCGGGSEIAHNPETTPGGEWTHEIQAGLTISSHTFWSFYYTAAGIHGLHVIVGAIIMAVIAVDAAKGIDLQRVDATHKIHTKIPFHFVNADVAPGVKLHGGIISHVMNELDVKCLPGNLPEFIEVDLKDLDVGHSIHVSQLKLPAGVEANLHKGEDPVVAALAIPRGAKADEAAAAEAAAAPADKK